MTVYRAVLAKWAEAEFPDRRRSLDGELTDEQIKKLNDDHYHIYFWPNYPSDYTPGTTIDGSQIDTFGFVFVDCDLKDKTYSSKGAFLERLRDGPTPTFVTDSGNGIHAFWQVSDLDAMSFLRLNRRLCRTYRTDPAVSQIAQLMRVPGTINPKHRDAFKECKTLQETENVYTCEQLDKVLSPITVEDEDHCIRHFNSVYKIDSEDCCIDDKLPLKFAHLLKNSSEAKDIWAGNLDDRSKGDYRLGHIMFANDFTRDEATSVLVNSSKALSRAPVHRLSYARNIIDKIWTFEAEPVALDELSQSVFDILQQSTEVVAGTRFSCHKYIDDTEAGFRLGHVMGLVGGSGVGKTALALNIFLGFVESNPDYVHFFVPLEQKKEEIAARWRAMSGTNERLHKKVHIISNYNDNGSFRDLSLEDIKKYIIEFQERTGKKVGCVVIDHIGVLCNNNKLGQDEGVKYIAKAMKSFAIQTNTFLIMQSQTSREKAGIGDLELNKDAAFGTSVFENFCDYLVCLWQPLKRAYTEGAPTVLAYKFCKIRHKKQGVDKLQEDVPYTLMFDPTTERVREMTQEESKGLPFWVAQATNKRKRDSRTDTVVYTSIEWRADAAVDQASKDPSGATRAG